LVDSTAFSDLGIHLPPAARGASVEQPVDLASLEEESVRTAQAFEEKSIRV